MDFAFLAGRANQRREQKFFAQSRGHLHSCTFIAFCALLRSLLEDLISDDH